MVIATISFWFVFILSRALFINISMLFKCIKLDDWVMFGFIRPFVVVWSETFNFIVYSNTNRLQIIVDTIDWSFVSIYWNFFLYLFNFGGKKHNTQHNRTEKKVFLSNFNLASSSSNLYLLCYTRKKKINVKERLTFCICVILAKSFVKIDKERKKFVDHCAVGFVRRM